MATADCFNIPRSEGVQAAVRTERDEIRRQVLTLVDRHLQDSRQQARWHADHWDAPTL